MSHPTYKKSLRALADRWGASTATIRRYAAKGLDWDWPDYEVALWLLTKAGGIKKPKAMREAIDAVPGIRTPHRAQNESCTDCTTFVSQPSRSDRPTTFHPHAVGALLNRQDELEQRVAKLKPDDVHEAFKLRGLLDELDAEFARLEATIPVSK